MLVILRVLFGFALFAVIGRAVEVAGPEPQTEGTTDAAYLAVAVIIGIANAVVWAPWVGQWMADPLTGAFTSGNPGDFSNPVLQFAHKLALRGWRRAALLFAFLEGVRHPDLPGAFVLGMQQARKGSWLEKVFAREVWRFDNADNCLKAWRILREHGVEPDLHRRPEVNLLLLSQVREVPPTPSMLKVAPAPPVPRPSRNPRIRIFTPSGAPPPEQAAVGPADLREAAAVACPVPAPVPVPTGESDQGDPAERLAAGSGIERMASSGSALTEPLAVAGRSAPRRRRRLTWSERLEALFIGELDD